MSSCLRWGVRHKEGALSVDVLLHRAQVGVFHSVLRGLLEGPPHSPCSSLWEGCEALISSVNQGGGFCLKHFQVTWSRRALSPLYTSCVGFRHLPPLPASGTFFRNGKSLLVKCPPLFILLWQTVLQRLYMQPVMLKTSSVSFSEVMNWLCPPS